MQMSTTAHIRSEVPIAGYRPTLWARAVGISRSGYYALPADSRPRSVTVGRMRIITESPSDWLARMGARDE